MFVHYTPVMTGDKLEIRYLDVLLSRTVLLDTLLCYRLWRVTLVLLSCLAAFSIILNIVLVCKSSCCRSSARSPTTKRSGYKAAPSRDESDSSVDPFEDVEAVALEPLRKFRNNERRDKKVKRTTKYKTRNTRNKSRLAPVVKEDT